MQSKVSGRQWLQVRLGILFGTLFVAALMFIPTATSFNYGNNFPPYPYVAFQAHGTSSRGCGTHAWSGSPPLPAGSWTTGVGVLANCPYDVETANILGSWIAGPAYLNGSTVLQVTANIRSWAYLDSVCPYGGGGDSALWVNITANFQHWYPAGANLSAKDFVLANVAADYTSCSMGVVSVPISYAATTSPLLQHIPSGYYRIWVNINATTIAYAGIEQSAWSSACAEMPNVVIPTPYCQAGSATWSMVSNIYVV